MSITQNLSLTNWLIINYHALSDYSHIAYDCQESYGYFEQCYGPRSHQVAIQGELSE